MPWSLLFILLVTTPSFLLRNHIGQNIHKIDKEKVNKDKALMAFAVHEMLGGSCQ